MKKRLTLLGVGAAVLILLLAQTSSAFDKAKLGFHIGGSMANLEGGELPYDYLNSVYAGMRVNSRVSRYFAYQFELNLARKGSETEIYSLIQKGELNTITGTLSVDYVELPLMVKAGLPMNFPVRPKALAGIYLAWRVGNSISYKEHIAEPEELIEIARNDYGVVTGVALDFTVVGRSVSLEFRYLRGLKESIERSTGDQLINGALTFVIAVTP